jgi:hypothetical protein
VKTKSNLKMRVMHGFLSKVNKKLRANAQIMFLKELLKKTEK